MSILVADTTKKKEKEKHINDIGKYMRCLCTLYSQIDCVLCLSSPFLYTHPSKFGWFRIFFFFLVSCRFFVSLYMQTPEKFAEIFSHTGKFEVFFSLVLVVYKSKYILISSIELWNAGVDSFHLYALSFYFFFFFALSFWTFCNFFYFIQTNFSIEIIFFFLF